MFFFYSLRSLDETWQSFYPAAIQPSLTLNKIIIIIIVRLYGAVCIASEAPWFLV